MNNFNQFLEEGKNIQIKRRYTENHPASSVGKTAKVRNKVLKAVKDGVITEEEFNSILSELSTSPNRWKTNNNKYFFVSEEGVKLSKWGLRILAELDENPTAVEISEEDKAEDPGEDVPGGEVSDKTKEQFPDDFDATYPAEKGKMSNEDKVTEAKFVKDFDKEVLDAEYKADITTYYPSAQFFIGKMTHFFGELEPNLFFKAYYAKYYKEDTGKKIDGEFKITSIYSQKGSKYVSLYNESVDESMVNEKDDAGTHLDKLAELVGKAKSFMDVGKELKAGKYKYDFGTGMMPHYQVEADGFNFMIVNKRYVDKGDREVNDIAIGLLENIKTQTTDMENTFLHESFSDFIGASGFLNEALGSSLLASVLMSNKEGKYGKENLKSLAGGFYGLAKVALDKVGDEDMVISNDPTKVFKEHGGSKHILFFISDNEKDNPYCPYDAGYGSLKTVPGGGLLIAAMSGDREFYTNDWSRYSRTKSFKKDGKKGSDGQVGVSHKYRGWSGTGLNNGKRIAEVSDRVLIINLDLIRQKYSTEQLRAARAEAKSGAIAFTNDKDFKKANNDRYHQILSTKAATMPLDKMVADAIDVLTDQIKAGLASGEKTRYDEIKIGESAKGKEVKLRDASNHMSNILDDYSRYCDYIRQEEESEKRFGSSESWYKREIKNYALSLKEKIAKIEGFDYAW
jgi:hypothetical protein